MGFIDSINTKLLLTARRYIIIFLLSTTNKLYFLKPVGIDNNIFINRKYRASFNIFVTHLYISHFSSVTYILT